MVKATCGEVLGEYESEPRGEWCEAVTMTLTEVPTCSLHSPHFLVYVQLPQSDGEYSWRL